MNIITQIHDEINALTWSQQIYNWDYVKNAPSPGCINDEEFASILTNMGKAYLLYYFN